MDEEKFWSCALGEWVRDCVCGPSSDPCPIVPEHQWRPSGQLDLQIRYAELCDGVALNMVLCYITSSDPSLGLLLVHPSDRSDQTLPVRGTAQSVERSESLSSGVSSGGSASTGLAPLSVRLRHFQNLINALRNFYRSRSLLLMSLPDVLAIAKFPVPEISGHEMHKLLGLLLGAAVQSPQREHFIERIRRMRPEVQRELAEQIQRITSNTGCPNSPVLNLDILLAQLEQQPQVGALSEEQQHQIVAMLERALKERDELANGMLEMAQDMEHDENAGGSNGTSSGSTSALTTASSSCNGDILPIVTKDQHQNGTFCDGERRSPSPSAMDRHANVELAAAKAELRKLRNENEEKEELLLELQDELDRQRGELGRLQSERLELVKDARAAKDLRDEMECMQHKLARLERAEAESAKLRGKISELDFYKSRVNNLKEDNQMMQETCRVMEEQLEQCQRKLSAHLEVETKLIESQATTKSLQLDLTKTRERMEDLLVENGRLERELKANVQKHAELERAMTLNIESPRNSSLNDSSLLAQMDAYNQSQMLELQLENRKLKARLEAEERAPNPAEMFELKAELTAREQLVEERTEECSRMHTELERTRSEVIQSEEKVRALETQLAEQRRTMVATKTHQTVVEQREKAEEKNKEAVAHAKRTAEQLHALQTEKRDLEMQLQRVRVQQRDARLEVDALQEMHTMEQEQWMRERKTLEGERNALRAKNDALERELETAKRNTENAARRASETEHERDQRVQLLDMEMEQMHKQIDAESRKAQRYRDELHTEQTRLSDLLGRLRSVCLTAMRQSDAASSDESSLAYLNDDVQLITIIDDLLLRALADARREADALRIQQQKQIRELDDLKKDIQNLRKTGHELNASDDQLLTQNRNIKEQVNILQERLQWAQSEESTRSAELQAAKREVEELQRKAFAHSRTSAELANAQLSLRTQQTREEQLRMELGGVRTQLDAAVKGQAETQKRLDSLELIHSALASDHDRLQNLHQMLSSDYDRIKREKEVIRQKMKGEKTSTEQMLRGEFIQERTQLMQALEEERAGRLREARRVIELETELAQIAKELAELKNECNSTLFRNADCADELRRLRLAECAQKSAVNSLNVIIQQLNNALTEKDLELANLRRQVEMLRQYNGEENRTLIRQIELLLVQNQQLHNRSDAFYAEQKELQEKLLNLRRHKEKLEEKIMEQYKQMDSRKLERPTFMKRAAKLISKSPNRKGRPKELTNSASDRSEESSCYSTDEPSRNTTALASSPPPPPPCPTATVQQPTRENGHDHLVNRSNDFHSRCSSSLYSSISSSYNRCHNGRQQLSNSGISNGCNNIESPGSMLRARNGRLGGSLRCPPPMMARSFPSPAQWRRRAEPEANNNNNENKNKLPACCKIIQEHDDLFGGSAMSEEKDSSMASIQLPPKRHHQPSQIQSPKIMHRISELPPKVPSPQNVVQRPPPPPYPGTVSSVPYSGTVPNTVPFRGTRASSSPPTSKTMLQSSFLAGRASIAPRDSSTPKSTSSSSSPCQINHAMSGSSPSSSPIVFSRVNNNVLGNKNGPADGNNKCQLLLPEEGQLREDVRDPAERAEKAASVYENVAGKTGEDPERREGPGGEIWYEFGCV